MGFDLSSSLSVTNSGWYEILKIAENNGWMPEGTEAPENWDSRRNGEWKGGYTSNDYQFVTGTDAQALVAALRKAVQKLELEKQDYPTGDENDPFFENETERTIRSLTTVADGLPLRGFLIG